MTNHSDDKLSKKDLNLLYNIYTTIPSDVLLNFFNSPDNEVLFKIITESYNIDKVVATRFMELEIWWNGCSDSHDIRKEFSEYTNTPEHTHSLIFQYLHDKETVLKYFIKKYSLLDCHFIESMLISISKDHSIEFSDYEPRYACSCKKFFSVYNKYRTDLRDLTHCCYHCGRSTKTWELISGRTCFVIKTTKRKWLGDVVEKFNVGFEPSKHLQYDSKKGIYDDYFNPQPELSDAIESDETPVDNN